MTSISVGTNDRKKGTVAEVFDESLIAELFNLLWGQERSVMPTVVDYAYEEIWKRVIMIGGSEEQWLSDVTLSEQLGPDPYPFYVAQPTFNVSDARHFLSRTHGDSLK